MLLVKPAILLFAIFTAAGSLTWFTISYRTETNIWARFDYHTAFHVALSRSRSVRLELRSDRNVDEQELSLPADMEA